VLKPEVPHANKMAADAIFVKPTSNPNSTIFEPIFHYIADYAFKKQQILIQKTAKPFKRALLKAIIAQKRQISERE
jgi:hypothetical protein